MARAEGKRGLAVQDEAQRRGALIAEHVRHAGRLGAVRAHLDPALKVTPHEEHDVDVPERRHTEVIVLHVGVIGARHRDLLGLLVVEVGGDGLDPLPLLRVLLEAREAGKGERVGLVSLAAIQYP